MRTFRICVLPGDGIGVEVIDATLPVLQKAAKGFSLELDTHPAGAKHYARTGEALPEKTFEAARRAHAILFGAMGWPTIRYPDGTEIAPQLDLRVRLELYAGVRPARAIPGVPAWTRRTCSRRWRSSAACSTMSRRWSAAWAWRPRPTSATSTPSSSPATARRRTSPGRAGRTRPPASCRRR